MVRQIQNTVLGCTVDAIDKIRNLKQPHLKLCAIRILESQVFRLQRFRKAKKSNKAALWQSEAVSVSLKADSF